MNNKTEEILKKHVEKYSKDLIEHSPLLASMGHIPNIVYCEAMEEFSTQQNKELIDKVAELTRNNESQVTRLKICLETDINELQSELSQQKELVEELKEKNYVGSGMLKNAHRDLDYFQIKTQDQEREIDSLLKKYSILEHEIEALKKELDVYKQNLEWRKGQIESQSLRIKELEEGNKWLKKFIWEDSVNLISDLKNAIPPFRIGKKQKRTILDSTGHELGIFTTGQEKIAHLFCDFLNNTTTETLSTPTTEPKEEKEGGEDE